METDRRGLIAVTVGVIALLLAATWPTAAAAPVLITPGVGIGPVSLGMSAAQVRLLDKDATPRISEDSVVFDLPTLRMTAWVSHERVERVRTRNPRHKTAAGVYPGDVWNEGILGMCGGMVMTSEVPEGLEIGCPFAGISFEVKGRLITAISVTRPARR